MMDELTTKKIRDLKLKIANLEKEQTQTQHTLGLQGWLKAGHAGQISKTAQKDRRRIAEKLGELNAQLSALEADAANEKAAPTPDAARKKR